MLARGVIRRIGAVPNHYRLGYTANGMTVWDVADEQVDALGEAIGGLSFVSHCYRRPRHLPDWPYNLFTMIHGQKRDNVETVVAQVAREIGIEQYEVLYSTREFKKERIRYFEEEA